MSSNTPTALRKVAGIVFWIAVIRWLFYAVVFLADVWVAGTWPHWWTIGLCMLVAVGCGWRMWVAVEDARDARREWYLWKQTEAEYAKQFERALGDTSEPQATAERVAAGEKVVDVITSMYDASPVTHVHVSLMKGVPGKGRRKTSRPMYRVSVMNRTATVRYNDFTTSEYANQIANDLSMHYGIPIM